MKKPEESEKRKREQPVRCCLVSKKEESDTQARDSRFLLLLSSLTFNLFSWASL